MVWVVTQSLLFMNTFYAMEVFQSRQINSTYFLGKKIASRPQISYIALAKETSQTKYRA